MPQLDPAPRKLPDPNAVAKNLKAKSSIDKVIQHKADPTVSPKATPFHDRLAQLGEDKVSMHDARMRAMLRRRKVLSIQLPEFVIEEFGRLQREAGMKRIEFFYHLLREAGADIPAYPEMDARLY